MSGTRIPQYRRVGAVVVAVAAIGLLEGVELLFVHDTGHTTLELLERRTG